jgi:hypothetical protein
MNVSNCTEQDKRKTKKCAWVATVIYCLLFPFLFMFAAASVMIFDSPSMPVPLGLSIIFLYFCVPLSIPFTFYFVWSRYSQGEYKKSRQFCLIPLYILMGTFIYDVVTDTLRSLF